MPNNYDVVVVGLGAMGSATLYQLAARGLRVLGLEQFSPGHTLGSSHGDSRIIRETYFEHPLYVPLVQRAHALWRELEERTGSTLMTITGGLMIGPREGTVVQGTLRSAREHRLPHEILDAEAVGRRYPAFTLPSDAVAVFDPRAGYLAPEACTAAHLDAARSLGAHTHFEEPVTAWTENGDGVSVKTPAARYSADRLVVTSGPWTGSLVRDLGLPLVIERQVLFWLAPAIGERYDEYDRRHFPIFAYEFKAGTICYGFPRLTRGVKVSVMHDGESVEDPSRVERSVSEGEAEPLRSALEPVLSALARAPIRGSAVCLFTNTPDHDFIIDFHPLHRRVLISSPCSGHGFKFASAIGELQADLVINARSKFDLTPFRIDRWKSPSTDARHSRS